MIGCDTTSLPKIGFAKNTPNLHESKDGILRFRGLYVSRFSCFDIKVSKSFLRRKNLQNAAGLQSDTECHPELAPFMSFPFVADR